MALAGAFKFRALAVTVMVLAITALVGATAADAKMSPLGVWLAIGGDDGKGHIEIYECGDKLCGRLIWSTSPEARDFNNPDETKHGRLLIRQDILWGLTPEGENFWGGGRIYDSTTGKTWNCSIRVMPGGDKLRLRGYVGISLFGQSRIWTRVR